MRHILSIQFPVTLEHHLENCPSFDIHKWLHMSRLLSSFSFFFTLLLLLSNIIYWRSISTDFVTSFSVHFSFIPSVTLVLYKRLQFFLRLSFVFNQKSPLLYYGIWMKHLEAKISFHYGNAGLVGTVFTYNKLDEAAG